MDCLKRLDEISLKLETLYLEAKEVDREIGSFREEMLDLFEEEVTSGKLLKGTKWYVNRWDANQLNCVPDSTTKFGQFYEKIAIELNYKIIDIDDNISMMLVKNSYPSLIINDTLFETMIYKYGLIIDDSNVKEQIADKQAEITRLQKLLTKKDIVK